MNWTRLLVVSFIPLVAGSFSYAADRQLRDRRAAGDPRALRGRPTGDLDVWRLLLPTGLVMLVVSLTGILVDALT